MNARRLNTLAVVVLLAAVLLGLGLRLDAMHANPNVQHDEAWSYATASGRLGAFEKAIQGGLSGRWVPASAWQYYWQSDSLGDLAHIGPDLAAYDVHPPLYFWILHLWLMLTGMHHWAGPALNLIFAVLTTLAAFSMPDNRLHVSFLDVGQGDAILIQTPNHQDILVDGGPSAQTISGELSQHLPFWDRTIELVVLTHPHLDHLTGLLEVLQRYKVPQVLYLDTDYQTPPEQEWLSLIQEKGIKATLARAGQVINLGTGATSIEVINPALDSSVPAMDNGIVLRLSDGKVSFLLTSDISQEAELDLITRRADLSSTVLKVSHHGSDTSSSAAFLAVVDPQLAVISVGADNTFGHPGQETMARLTVAIGFDKIYRTDKNGTIECITNGEKLWMKTER